ncbi:hypothetical protein D3C72_2041550 [compost metagenome]
MSLAGEIVLTIGIDERIAWRQRCADLVMVDDDHVDTAPCRHLKRLVAGRAAVDGDDEAGAVVDQLFDRLWVGPISLEDTIRDIDFRIEPEMLEEARHQRRRCGAVDIVIAEDHHLLAP